MQPISPSQDRISIERLQTLHPKLREEALAIYTEVCAALTGRAFCRIAFAYRTFAEQDALYAQGRTKPGKIVTNAKAGASFHNYGLALDIVLIIDGKEASWDMKGDFDGDHIADWMEVVKIFKAHGWEWGGDWRSFKDYPHFQKTFGYTESQLLQRFRANQVIPGTAYVRI